MPGEITKQVILIQPWLEDFYATDCRNFPSGLAYLAGSIKKKFPEIDVRIYDILQGAGKKTIPWPREFSFLKPFYGLPDSSPFSLFHQYYRFGEIEEKIAQKLSAGKPLLIGISALFSPYYRESLKVSRICKKIFPEVPVVMGGNHASMHPETLLSVPARLQGQLAACDYVLRGEAEESICELIEHLLGRRNISEVQNLVTHSTGFAAIPLKIPRRDLIPEPDYKSLDINSYHFNGKPSSVLITSRSCPYKCTFCSIHAVFGQKYWRRDNAAILQEIRNRFSDGIRHFDIEDDNFTFKRASTLELLNNVKFLKLDVTFSAMNGLCYWHLDQELIEAMKSINFQSLNLSLVSQNQETLKLAERPADLEKFANIITLAVTYQLPVTAYLILGLPGQSIGDIWHSIQFLTGLQCLIGGSPFYLTPGSAIHQRLATDKKLSRKVLVNSSPQAQYSMDPFFSARLTTLGLATADFSREEIFTFFKLLRVINYIKKGLDQNLKERDPFFHEAKTIFKEKKWYAKTKRNSMLLPFSPRVAELISGQDLIVMGFKTGNSIFINC